MVLRDRQRCVQVEAEAHCTEKIDHTTSIPMTWWRRWCAPPPPRPAIPVTHPSPDFLSQHPTMRSTGASTCSQCLPKAKRRGGKHAKVPRSVKRLIHVRDHARSFSSTRLSRISTPREAPKRIAAAKSSRHTYLCSGAVTVRERGSALPGLCHPRATRVGLGRVRVCHRPAVNKARIEYREHE